MSDQLWNDVRAHLDEMQVLELILLTGFYHTVAYLTNSVRLPLEAFAERFPRTRTPHVAFAPYER